MISSLSFLKCEDVTVPRVEWWMWCLWPTIDGPTIKAWLFSQLWLSKINADSILPFDVQSCTPPRSQLVSLEWLMCNWIFLSCRRALTFSSLIHSLFLAQGSRCLFNINTENQNLMCLFSCEVQAGLMHWTFLYFGIVYHIKQGMDNSFQIYFYIVYGPNREASFQTLKQPSYLKLSIFSLLMGPDIMTISCLLFYI